MAHLSPQTFNVLPTIKITDHEADKPSLQIATRSLVLSSHNFSDDSLSIHLESLRIDMSTRNTNQTQLQPRPQLPATDPNPGAIETTADMQPAGTDTAAPAADVGAATVTQTDGDHTAVAEDAARLSPAHRRHPSSLAGTFGSQSRAATPNYDQLWHEITPLHTEQANLRADVEQLRADMNKGIEDLTLKMEGLRRADAAQGHADKAELLQAIALISEEMKSLALFPRLEVSNVSSSPGETLPSSSREAGRSSSRARSPGRAVVEVFRGITHRKSKQTLTPHVDETSQ